MDSATQFFSIIILLGAFVISVIAAQFWPFLRARLTRRRLSAYDALPALIGNSIESGRPLHLSLGSAAIGEDNTLTALVGAEFFYQVTRQVAIGDTPPIFTVTDTTAIPLGMDTMRRAYQDADALRRWNALNVRWYPSGVRSLAFAGAVTAMLTDDRLASNVLAGSFGNELALILDASNRRKRPTLATSDQLEGQAIAWALADHVLIGEEVFTAGAYLSDDKGHQTRLLTTDALRWLLIAALVLLTIFYGTSAS